MPSVQVISAKQVSCTRGDNTLFEQLSFQVQSGECLHVTGANGCGKTSLLRIICGINRSETGDVKWNDTSTHASPDFYQQSAYIAHKDGLKSELTAIENLRYYQHLEGKKDEDTLDAALAKMQILKCADLTAQQLSFGQRRRLAFARLLMADFSLWVLDEPFTGIDAAGRTLIEQLCVEHLEQAGLIIMTHHQSLSDSPLNAYRKELALGQI